MAQTTYNHAIDVLVSWLRSDLDYLRTQKLTSDTETPGAPLPATRSASVPGPPPDVAFRLLATSAFHFLLPGQRIILRHYALAVMGAEAGSNADKRNVRNISRQKRFNRAMDAWIPLASQIHIPSHLL